MADLFFLPFFAGGRGMTRLPLEPWKGQDGSSKLMLKNSAAEEKGSNWWPSPFSAFCFCSNNVHLQYITREKVPESELNRHLWAYTGNLLQLAASTGWRQRLGRKEMSSGKRWRQRFLNYIALQLFTIHWQAYCFFFKKNQSRFKWSWGWEKMVNLAVIFNYIPLYYFISMVRVKMSIKMRWWGGGKHLQTDNNIKITVKYWGHLSLALKIYFKKLGKGMKKKMPRDEDSIGLVVTAISCLLTKEELRWSVRTHQQYMHIL